MRIVTDMEEIYQLVNQPTNWGAIITDQQFIVFAQVEGERWESHAINYLKLLKSANPNASDATIELKGERVVFITKNALGWKTLFIPSDDKLSKNQLDCLLSFLQGIKGPFLESITKFLFLLGEEEPIFCTLKKLLLKLELMEPKYLDIEWSEKIIGIPIDKFISTKKQQK